MFKYHIAFSGVINVLLESPYLLSPTSRLYSEDLTMSNLTKWISEQGA